MDSGLVLNRIEVIEVIESGDHAIDTGAIYLNVPDGSGGFTEVGMKYVVAWRKDDDGVWRLHRDTWNALP